MSGGQMSKARSCSPNCRKLGQEPAVRYASYPTDFCRLLNGRNVPHDASCVIVIRAFFTRFRVGVETRPVHSDTTASLYTACALNRKSELQV